MKEELYTTVTSWPPEEDKCKHLNGFYDTVKIFFWDRKVFVCTDCKEILPPKELTE